MAEPQNGLVAGRTPIQTVHADFPHTASQRSLRSRHYANSGIKTHDHAAQRRSASRHGFRHGRSGPAFAWPQPQSAWQLARFDDGPTPIGVIGTGRAGHASRVLAPPTGPLQASRHVAARVLVPSSEALDTPLGPRRSLAVPGVCYSALRCLPRRDFHPLETNSVKSMVIHPLRHDTRRFNPLGHKFGNVFLRGIGEG